MSSSLRPQYFCSRPNGNLTSLIAVDELAPNVSVRGAPRVLSPSETQGMTSLGTVIPRGQFYHLEGISPTASRPSSTGGTNYQPGHHDLQSALLSIINNENFAVHERMGLNNFLQHVLPQIWHTNNPSATGWLVPKNGGSPGHGNGQQTRNVKKEFCSYWIRHGECDYQQQGCLYKHEMPLDKEGLEKVGLRDIPKWYRERFSLPSLLPHGHGHPRPHTANNPTWKHDAPVKSIQYPHQMESNGSSQHSDSDKTIDQRSLAPLPTQELHQAPVLSGTSQMAFNPIASPMTSFPQAQALIPSPGPLSTGSQKSDLLSWDHPASDYMSTNNLLFRPSNETSLDAPKKTPHEELVHSLHSLTMSPGLPSADSLASPYDSIAGPGRFSNAQRSRRLYEGPQNALSINIPEQANMHGYHNQVAVSSNDVSPASKATGSQLTSPGLGTPHGSNISVSPPHGVDVSPTARSHAAGAVPNNYFRRGNSKGPRRPFDAFGGRKSHNKRSGESSEDDLLPGGK
ncbi:uncharacterized protein BDV17DRAFT_174588 [Aspergillus undulatus]|uniref:uncharacterized protein n=1 Tax=Aspergillus undulatus TaxID=1810928 RepID=UPI003CCD0D92